MNRDQILKNAVALPGDAGTDENRYPVLGSVVFYGLRDIRISKADLAVLFIKNKLPASYLPPEVRAVDAYKRATKEIESKPKMLPDGTFEVLLVREVADTKDELVRQVTREIRVSKESTKPLDYSRVAQLIFRRETKEYIPHSITTEIEPVIEQSVATYKEFLNFYTGKAVREIVHSIVISTNPVSLKPFGAIYFVSREHLALMDSLEGLVKDLIPYQVTTPEFNWDMVFESIPMMDVEKQRKLIFEKYESQVIGSVDSTLSELAVILTGTKVPSIAAKAGYIDRINEIKAGIGKYEGLLQRDMAMAKLKVEMLDKQIMALASFNPKTEAASASVPVAAEVI